MSKPLNIDRSVYHFHMYLLNIARGRFGKAAEHKAKVDAVVMDCERYAEQVKKSDTKQPTLF